MRHRDLAATALIVLAACSEFDEAVVDPFDPTVLPRIHLVEGAQIGGGSSEPVLHNVSGAIVLRSGEIALANANSEILVFSVQGDVRLALGRTGSGPGEFRFLQHIVRLDNDNILAWDPALSRITVFRPDGQLDYMCTPRQEDLARVGGGFVGAFGDGSFVLEGRSYRESPQEAADGLRSDSVPYLLFDHSGTFIRILGPFARSLRHYSATSGYQRFLMDTSVLKLLSGGELLVGETDSIVLARFDSSGIVQPRFTLDRTPRLATDSDIEAGWHAWEISQTVAREEMMGQAELTLDRRALLEMRERIRATVREGLAAAKETIQPAEYLPAYKSIMVGSDGALWMEDYLHPIVTVSRWILMGPDFAPVGWIELQQKESLLAAGPDFVIVLRKDELDVESVVSRRFRR